MRQQRSQLVPESAPSRERMRQQKSLGSWVSLRRSTIDKDITIPTPSVLLFLAGAFNTAR